MTVAELIAKLQALPQDLPVACAAIDGTGHWDGYLECGDPRVETQELGYSGGAQQVVALDCEGG